MILIINIVNITSIIFHYEIMYANLLIMAYPMETYYSTFLKVGCHNNNFTIMFPYHPPEVFNGVLHGTLRCYVLFGVVPVTLCVQKHVYVLANGFSAGSTHPHKVSVDII